MLAVRKQRQHGLFNRKFLTSFVSWVENDSLYIVFSRVEWNLENMKKMQKGKLKKSLPMPQIDDEVMKFRTVSSLHLDLAGRQGVSTHWRDPYWRHAGTITKTGKGGLKRRTVLMESEIPEEEWLQPVEPQTLPESADVLRALADLEDERREGKITESEYRRQRDALLAQ